MKKVIFLFFLGFLCVNQVFSQDHAFIVMGTKGPNQVKSGDAWESIKAFSKLGSTDVVRLSDNSYLGLSHATSGKAVELTKAGDYIVADLAGKAVGSTSVLNKYTEFILSKNSAEAKNNRLAATGAVHRGLNDIKFFIPADPKLAVVYGQVLAIGWDGHNMGGTYVMTAKDLFDTELFRKETSETTLEIDLTQPKLASEPQLYLEVFSKQDPKKKTEKTLIKKMSVSDKAKIDQALKEFNEEMPDDSAMKNFILAGFFESNNLQVDAVGAYLKAIKLSEGVPTFEEAYSEFLLRNGFKTEQQ